MTKDNRTTIWRKNDEPITTVIMTTADSDFELKKAFMRFYSVIRFKKDGTLIVAIGDHGHAWGGEVKIDTEEKFNKLFDLLMEFRRSEKK